MEVALTCGMSLCPFVLKIRNEQQKKKRTIKPNLDARRLIHDRAFSCNESDTLYI